MKRSIVQRCGLLLLAGVLLVMAGAAFGAATPPRAATPHATVHKARRVSPKPAAIAAARAKKSVTKSKTAGPANAMRIFRDPETGEIGPPTAENTAALAREIEPVDVRTLPQVALPGGGYELLIDGKIEDAMIVRIDKNGHRVMTCTTDPQKALKMTPPPAPAQQTREDR